MRSHPHSTDDAAFSLCAALAPHGAFYSHRSLVPSGLRRSGGFLPVSTVEPVPVALPHAPAAGTPYSVR